MRSLRIVLLLALASCVDLGHDIDLEAGAGGGAATGEGGGGGPDGCEEGPVPGAADGPEVTYRNMAADPPTITIASGNVVTWTNADSMRHSVIAGAPGAPLPVSRGGFDSGELAQGVSWSFRFCTPRTVVYFCGTHPAQMNGYRVVVR